jgi:hypothetical protein
MPGRQALHIKATSTSPNELEMTAEGFYLDRQSGRCSEATMIWYHKYVGALFDWLQTQGITELTQIKAMHLRKWLVDWFNKSIGLSIIPDYSWQSGL